MAPPKQPNPKVFISYSHDSPEHAHRVLALAERFRKDGLDAQLDQYVAGTAPEGWPRWMLDRLDEADFILSVCTETYYRRFRGHEEPGQGKGADWEGQLITLAIYHAKSRTERFVPVFFEPKDERFIPEPVSGHTHYLLNSEDNYAKLYAFLTSQAGIVPVKLGPLQMRTPRAVEPLTFGYSEATPTLVVDALGRGNYVTLTEALQAAKPDDKILVWPAVYKENLVIDKPVEIIGHGDRKRVVIEATRKHTVLFQATKGRIANLTLKQTSDGEWYCVDIACGCLELEECDISSNGQAGVTIHGDAEPQLRRNRIHHCKGGGVYVHDAGGFFEDNDMHGNAWGDWVRR